MSVDSAIQLLGTLCAIMVAGYLVSRLVLLTHTDAELRTWGTQLNLIVIFGVLSMYGTLGGFSYGGTAMNVRDIAPAVGGMMFGPAVGIGSGLIGGGHRWFGVTKGPETREPCATATMVVGLLSGLIWRWRKGLLPPVWLACAFGVFASFMHMGFVASYAPDWANQYYFHNWGWLVKTLTYIAGMGLFVFVARHLLKERELVSSKAAMESELAVARDIQRNILPKVFPPYPDRKDIDLHALLEPAKEVGGDFFDFFLVNDRKLALILGDVSGKGVPGALFMAVTRTMFRARDWSKGSLSENVAAINDDLSADNGACMFVTIFCAMVDLETGVMEYCNCGHNPPYIIRKGGKVEALGEQLGPMMGVMPGAEYASRQAVFSPGDAIFIYTDGITEAENPAQLQYSEERLCQLLAASDGKSAEELCRVTRQSVTNFATGAVQSDDITMLVFRYLGGAAK